MICNAAPLSPRPTVPEQRAGMSFSINGQLRNRVFDSWKLSHDAGPQRAAAALPAPVRQAAGDAVDYLHMRAAALRNHLIQAGGRLYVLAGPAGSGLCVCEVAAGEGDTGLCVAKVAGEAPRTRLAWAKGLCLTRWLQHTPQAQPCSPAPALDAASVLPATTWRKQTLPFLGTRPLTQRTGLAAVPSADAATRPAEAPLDPSLAQLPGCAAPGEAGMESAGAGSSSSAPRRLLVSEGRGDLRLVELRENGAGGSGPMPGREGLATEGYASLCNDSALPGTRSTPILAQLQCNQLCVNPIRPSRSAGVARAPPAPPARPPGWRPAVCAPRGVPSGGGR